MRLILSGVLALFALKIAWNLSVPYVLAYRSWRKGGEASSSSLMPVLEVALWLLALLLSFTVDSERLVHSSIWIGIGGLAVILLSLVHFVVVGAALGWVIGRREQRRG